MHSFQISVRDWMRVCFGDAIAADRTERCDRFLEEALELCQSTGWPADRAHALVDYVYGRPDGDPKQEVGGVMVTLAALCLALDIDMDEAGDIELARVWTKIGQIRAKQAAKPTGSALPVWHATPSETNEFQWTARELAAIRQQATGAPYTEINRLAEPSAADINMLSVTVAKPSWDEIKRLYPEEFAALEARLAAVTEDRDRLSALINHPENEDWFKGVEIEAAHQIERWGSDYDVGKTPFDWFWLIGYLAQKAATSATTPDINKAKHHTISTAAALLNWHRQLSGASSAMRPGIDPVERGIE